MPVFTFFNYAPICCSTASNEANPYPSLISVFALPPTISNISVHLYGLQSESLGDISILLVAPSDSKSNLVLLNFVGNNIKPQPEVNISIIDNGTIMPFYGPLSDSVYKPTSYSNMVPPISKSQPRPPYHHPSYFGNSSFDSCFLASKIPLDGLWSLFVFSSAEEEISYSISGGWSISFYYNIPD